MGRNSDALLDRQCASHCLSCMHNPSLLSIFSLHERRLILTENMLVVTRRNEDSVLFRIPTIEIEELEKADPSSIHGSVTASLADGLGGDKKGQHRPDTSYLGSSQMNGFDPASDRKSSVSLFS